MSAFCLQLLASDCNGTGAGIVAVCGLLGPGSASPESGSRSGRARGKIASVNKLQGIGVWASARGIGESNLPEAAKLVEQLGYSAFWLGGAPRVAVLSPLLL